MSNKEREDSISRMRRGETWILVSTEVMARGMDFKGIREVINYDFPTSVQSYIHRIGLRAGTRRQVFGVLMCQSYRSDRTRGQRGEGSDLLYR